MRFTLFCAVLAAVGLLTGGCARGTTIGSYSETLGTSSQNTIQNQVPRILRGRYGFSFERQRERSQYLRYRTYWKEEGPLPDERNKGISSVRIRITITAKPRDRSAGTYTAQMEADYQVQGQGGSNWEVAELTPNREEKLDEIYEDLSDQLSSGVIGR